MENTEAKRNIKLIAFDLDGTTLHGFAELSERNRRAMEKANDAGILVVPATGRVRNFIPPCLTELPFIRYAITSNGGAVWDILENKVLCTDLIPTETALEVQKIFDERDILVYIYTINDKEEARRYLANGAQGVCTDVLITDNLN